MADHLELSFALVAEVEMPGVREDDLASLAASVLSAEGAAGSCARNVALVSVRWPPINSLPMERI